MDIANLLLSHPLTHQLALTLLHFLWQGVLLSAFLFIYLRATPSKYSNSRYAAALTTLLACLLAPIVTFLLLSDQAANIASYPGTIQLDTLVSSASSASGSSIVDFQSLLPFLTLGWLVGILYLCTKLFFGFQQVNSLTSRNTTAPSVVVSTMFDELLQGMQISAKVTLRISESVNVPMVIGWMKPIVLLPAALVTGLSNDQIKMLLAHELAHVKRHDYLVNLLQIFIEILLFFHPGVKWISGQIRIEREYCCDDSALACSPTPTDYAKALAQAETMRQVNYPDLTVAATGGSLKKRIYRMIDEKSYQPQLPEKLIVGCIALLIAAAFVVIVFSYKQFSRADVSKDIPMLMLNESSTHQTNNTGKSLQKPVINIETSDLVKQPVETKLLEIQSNPSPKLESLQQKQQKTLEVAAIAEVKKDLIDVEAQTTESGKSERQAQVAQTQQLPAAVEPSSTALTADADVRTTEKSIQQRTIALADPVKSDAINPPSKAAAEPTSLKEHYPSLAKETSPLIKEHTQKQAIPKMPTKPLLVKSTQPKYPVKALKRGLHGDVKVSFLVDESGDIADIEFLSSTSRYFENSVERALEEWEFEPGSLNGTPVALRVNRVFSFAAPKHVYATITGSRIARLK